MTTIKDNVWPATVLGLAVVALVAFALWCTKDLLALFGLFGLLAPAQFVGGYNTKEYEEEECESCENKTQTPPTQQNHPLSTGQNEGKETQCPYEGSIF